VAASLACYEVARVRLGRPAGPAAGLGRL